MGTKDLLEQWNEKMVQGNKLSREIEDFESILTKAELSQVCVHNSTNNVTTWLHTVLDERVMNQLKVNVLNTLVDEKKKRETELIQMINPVPRKAATINKEFDQAVNEMIEHNQAKIVKIVKDEFQEIIKEVPKPELTVELVKEMYHDKDMTLDQVAKELDMPRTKLYNFITENGLRKPSKKEQETFRDTKVQTAKKKPQISLSLR